MPFKYYPNPFSGARNRSKKNKISLKLQKSPTHSENPNVRRRQDQHQVNFVAGCNHCAEQISESSEGIADAPSIARSLDCSFVRSHDGFLQ